MDLFLIFITAFFVGLSGAMMPGPVTIALAEQSMRRGFLAGPLLTLGHGILELLLIFLIAAGLGRYLAAESVAGVFGLGGAFLLAWLGYKMIRSAVSGNLTMKTAAEKGE